MHASRLRQFIQYLLKAETRLALQNKLNLYVAAMANLVAQPQDPAHQTAVADTLNAAHAAFTEFEGGITPAQLAALSEIGASQYFSTSIISNIKSMMASNPLTPTVVQQSVNELVTQRGTYIESLKSASTSLGALKVPYDELATDTAEIGFLIPRDLFNNRLDLLVKELRDIELIIRQFSEVVIGRVEEIHVRQISTSNPLFFFEFNPVTIAAIGASITWMLNTWKQALDIKKKYNELKALGIDDDILVQIEDNVKKKVEQSIQERAAELIAKYDGKDPGRKSELENGLKWAMQALMARVERGLIVEIHYLPPPKPKQEGITPETQAAYDAQAEKYEHLSLIAKDLEFPAIEGEPILKIPPAKNVDGSSPVAKSNEPKTEPRTEPKKKQ